jgi:hypothetical protein
MCVLLESYFRTRHSNGVPSLRDLFPDSSFYPALPCRAIIYRPFGAVILFATKELCSPATENHLVLRPAILPSPIMLDLGE